MQSGVPNRDYLSISLGHPGEDSYNNSKIPKRQSLWRIWNRLSSLQRTVILLIVILGVLCAFYIIPNLGKSGEGKDLLTGGRQRLRPADLLGPKEVEEMQIEKQNKLKELEMKRNAQHQINGIMKQLDEAKKHPPGEREGEKDREMMEDRKKEEVEERPVLLPPGEQDVVPVENSNKDKVKEEQIDSPVDNEEEEVQNLPKFDYFSSGRKTNFQQEAVARAFKESWQAYRKYAWGHDEFHPLSKKSSEWFGVGLTILDSIDTAVIMGLQEEYEQAREFVKNDVNFNRDKDVNLFEMTIRVLGGLLSAFHLTGDTLFKEKAREVGDRLMPAFSSGSRVPYSDVNLMTGKARAPKWGPDSSTSEVSTIQLEFRDLSRVTGDPKYEEAVERVSEHLHSQPKKDGLVPIFINADSGRFRSTATISFGARGDTYYEYLLKQWIQTGKTQDVYKQDYLEAMEGMKKNLLRQSEPSKLTYIGELLSGRSFSPKMDHLVCFMGGTLALGQTHGLHQDHMDIAKEITRTCYEMYRRMPTGLSPEIVYFNQAPGAEEDLIVKPLDAHNLLRPETVESLFYLYRFTNDEKYREWGWKIFKAFEKHTRIEGFGYSSINNVKNAGSPGFRDKLESFFLAETLKYLYLLFSDDPDLIPLDKYIFNSEAHPLPIYES